MSSEVRRAAQILRAGGLVAFPTETVYGLGADAANPAAITKLYSVKRRPAEHPVIVHFQDAEKAFAWAREVPEAARKLAAIHRRNLCIALAYNAFAVGFAAAGLITPIVCAIVMPISSLSLLLTTTASFSKGSAPWKS